MITELTTLPEALAGAPSYACLAWGWLATADLASDRSAWAQQCLAQLAGIWGSSTAAVVERGAQGPVVLERWGAPSSPPAELVSDVLDGLRWRRQLSWWAAPLMARGSDNLLLCLEVNKGGGPAPHAAAPSNEVLAGLALALGRSWQVAEGRKRSARLAARAAGLLEATRRWMQPQPLANLLVDLAETATRLLDAERSSIFLWDRARHELVGRPALGVPDGELRVPDDRGVVGQVLRTGLPRRVTDQAEVSEIDHTVDARLGFRTHSLLCVPLDGPAGERLGVFEVLNHLAGTFSADDEQWLVSLAGHAAVALGNAHHREVLLRNQRQLADQAAERVQLIGSSPAMEALRSTVRRVAQTDLAVLVLGENGVGKEVVSQAIHYGGPRRELPFVAVNCAAISETLLESELFGHEKGAFTDAHEARPGKFEAAAGGTLCLDEIGDLSLAGQAKLLRVLEDKTVVRVGGSRSIAIDARVIAATNQPLADLVRQKRFRQDLYYRLTVVTLEIPPLRQRPEDIWPLTEFFLGLYSARAKRSQLKLSDAARRKLDAHDWPGNVRELRNLIERLVYLSGKDTIEAEDLSFAVSASALEAETASFTGTLTAATDAFQVLHIRRAIRDAQGNMSLAAERLGLHRSNLYRKLRQLGLSADET